MLRKACLAAIVVGASLLPLQGASAGHHEHAAATGPLRVAVIGPAGGPVGSLDLEQTPHGVLISVEASGLPAGEHAIHIHAKGLCDAAAGFASAGGHFEPGTRAHGIKDVAGPHAGDMPNQFAGKDGILRAQVLNSAVALGAGANSLMDEDGSALVIHEKADDYTSQPTGNAGGRMACAVIAPPR